MMKFIKKYKYYIIIVGLLSISYIVIGNDMLKLNIQNSVSNENGLPDFWIALFMEAFVSIHMSVFVLWPLSYFAANPKEKFKKLFIGRAIILLVCDILISPMFTAIVDFMSVFIGAFIIVPLVSTTKSQNPFMPSSTNIEYKNNSGDQEIKYNLSTSLATYLFALSENDRDEIKKITSKKMYDETLKIIDNAETYNKRNIIDDVDIKKFDILIRCVNNNEEFIHANIKVRAIDYTEYSSMTNINNKKENYEYRVVFKKVNDNTPSKVELDRCPYCSASITDKSILECAYCGSLLVEKKNEWLIEKLEKTLIK